MKLARRQFLRSAAAAVALPSLGVALATGGAFAQQPGRTISIVVPFAAGGGVDVLARAIAEPLQQRLGQTVIIDNKPGASGNIGAQAVARAAADGHTLLLTVDPPFTANIGLMKNVPYDPSKSFSPIVEVAVGTLALVVHSSMPVTSTEAFIDYARSRSGQINYGSSGVGTPHHLTMEFFKLTARVNLLHVPFRDTAGATQNLLGGHVGTAFLPLNVALPLPQDKVRILAVASKERVAAAPGLPTFIEQGFAEFESYVRFGLLAPAGTPRDVVVRYTLRLPVGFSRPSADVLVCPGLLRGGRSACSWSGAARRSRSPPCARSTSAARAACWRSTTSTST